MRFRETEVSGVYEIGLEERSDERGFFARSWCQEEFAKHGLNSRIVQCNVSFNAKRGTLRGLHYQDQPFPEAKVIRCTRGAIYDVAVDLRSDSPTFRKWTGVELTSENRKSLYVPEGCAHGFLTLTDATEIFYLMSESYHGDLSRGVRWNDPAFAVVWPGRVEIISSRDASYPDFK